MDVPSDQPCTLHNGNGPARCSQHRNEAWTPTLFRRAEIVSKSFADNPAVRHRLAAPPAIGCPEWCSLPADHSWEPDGTDFTLHHDSGEMAASDANYSLRVIATDW